MPSHAERLAWRAGCHKIHLAAIDRPIELGKIAVVRHVGVVVLEHALGKRLDLRERDGFPTERLPCGRRCADARTDGNVSHPRPRASGVVVVEIHARR